MYDPPHEELYLLVHDAQRVNDHYRGGVVGRILGVPTGVLGQPLVASAPRSLVASVPRCLGPSMPRSLVAMILGVPMGALESPWAPLGALGQPLVGCQDRGRAHGRPWALKGALRPSVPPSLGPSVPLGALESPWATHGWQLVPEN